MLACIHYSQLPLFCCLFSLRLHSFFLCLSPSRHRAAPESLFRGVFAPLDPSLSSSTATGRERLITRGPIEAWLQLHLHHCHRFREEDQELEEETENLATGPKTEWAVIHPIPSTSTSHLSFIIIPTYSNGSTALYSRTTCWKLSHRSFSVRNLL